jgi:hypothetical protein
MENLIDFAVVSGFMLAATTILVRVVASVVMSAV